MTLSHFLVNCSFVCQVVVFAFIISHFLRTHCFGTWLHGVTTITLTGTLLGLGFFLLQWK
jgi:hypothetical protein